MAAIEGEMLRRRRSALRPLTRQSSRGREQQRDANRRDTPRKERVRTSLPARSGPVQVGIESEAGEMDAGTGQDRTVRIAGQRGPTTSERAGAMLNELCVIRAAISASRTAGRRDTPVDLAGPRRRTLRRAPITTRGCRLPWHPFWYL